MQDEHKKSYGARERRRHFSQVFKLVWLLLALAFFGVAQGWVAAAQQPGSIRMGEALQAQSGDIGTMDVRLAARQLQMLNVQRQKTMISDADKLLKLATELKAEIASSDSVSLSAEQLHKISEIEKLARTVKQKMTFTPGAGLPLQELFVP